ncbi:hypothetical protein BKP37_16765 [Anaerobacillus alkalilacustris]|uniref:PAS domain S-box protein n=1 Tax=Anaerobacillus alkalilacustris TaxID=393763 RepID=A0A1S2LEW2_9BACI|nr:EAL domain-containing protein [Anaerobacillus alkalilacustris]OIJ11062.1 hypothetical protein BKP37_16765 [Anaerobacillus alkalilacustris]
MRNNTELLKEIEHTRKLMVKHASLKGLSSEETIKVSQKLDHLLNEYDKIEKMLRNESTDHLAIDIERINSVINNEAKILITDTEGVILFVNEKCCQVIGYEKDEIIGKHTRVFNSGYHSTQYFKDMWNTILLGDIWKDEIKIKRKDGSTTWNEMTIFPVLDAKGNPYQFLTLREDISDKKEFEFRAIQKERMLNFFTKNSNDVIGIIDQEMKIIYQNNSVEQMMGYKVEDVIGTNLFDYFNNEDTKTKKLKNLVAKQEKSLHFHINVRHKNGSWILCELNTTNYIDDPYINGIVFSLRTINEQEKVSHLSYYDYLTGLNNRRSFEKRLAEEIIHSKEDNLQFTVILINLDGFKYVNDSFGHDVGDKLLREVSLRLRNVLNKKLFCGRLGGDEYGLIFPNTNNFDEIHQVGKFLVNLFDENPFKIDDYEFFISASIGISVYPSSGDTIKKLLKHAGTAVYHSKMEGKNQYQIYSPNMNLNSFKMFTLKNDLKKALVKEEFIIYFQPRINPLTFEVTGAEALMRWNHRKWGIVSPIDFISLAEESGLIVKMGEWLLREVCRQIKGWLEQGINFEKISINISSLQLFQADFVSTVSTILNEEGVDSSYLEFEITESVIIDREEHVLKTLKQLKSMGISLALDDFGTGYSSLNYLRKLPCDTIKIDKSLINDILSNNETYEIFEATIRLCHKLNKSVVVEGIETNEQLSIIQTLDCKEFQGYLCSKPLKQEKFVEFLLLGKWTKEPKKKMMIQENQEII